MERARRDHAVVRVGLLELLERQPAEEIAERGGRVDSEHVVARDGERRRQLAPAATNFEQPSRWGGQMLAGKLLERRQQSRLTVATPSFAHSAAIATGQRHHWIGAPTNASRPR